MIVYEQKVVVTIFYSQEWVIGLGREADDNLYPQTWLLGPRFWYVAYKGTLQETPSPSNSTVRCDKAWERG